MKEIRFTIHNMAELDPPRELTALERSVLRELVSVTPDAEPALCQIDHARVSAECIEGCGTIELIVSPGCPKLSRAAGPLAEGDWHPAGKWTKTVLLHAYAGDLDYLETFPHDARLPRGLPPAEELTTWAG